MRAVLRPARTLAMAGGLLLGTLSAASAAVPAVAADASGTTVLLTQAAKSWFKVQWAAYRASFVSPDGRIVDNANGGVSHSEGQGYGLLLAVMADDRESFATIWRWTSTHLQVRPDALFAWKWDPGRNEVADRNNATDGDLLIAWALLRASRAFGLADYEVAARRIVDAVAAGAVRQTALGPVLLPGLAGFAAGEQPDGPVVNPSYWIFTALRDFAALWPKGPWNGLHHSGLKLLEASRFGPLALPADWIGLGGNKPAPARRFAASFGYDAIRIPLYLAWDRDAPSKLVAGFARFSPASNAAVIEVATGAARETMGGAGYRAVIALARCAARGETIPADLMTTRDALYYSETLRLLSIAVVQERFPQCL